MKIGLTFIWLAALLWVGGVLRSSQADANEVALLATYGSEQRVAGDSAADDLVRYLGAMFLLDKQLEVQILIAPFSKFDGGTEINVNYHYEPFKEVVTPFFNIGVGHNFHYSRGVHFNTDFGVQFTFSNWQIRTGFKAMVQPFGIKDFGDGAWIFSLGHIFRF